jgi:hypothetical protein
VLSRITRDTGIACAVFVIIALVLRPGEWGIPLGIAGGGALIGLSFWVIRSTVDAGLERARRTSAGSGGGRFRVAFGLVKFFTRYAMLAFAAYVMMARLHLDPVGMLAGVSALGVAAGAEALRASRRPSAGRRG